MTARLRRSGSRAELAVLALLGAWVLLPDLALVLRPLVNGGVFTGVTGIDPVDEFQYLAWIRDSGTHGLSANLFGMAGGGHVFLQPMWFLSGLLWRIGIGLQLAYLLWAPVTVVVLWIGFNRFARRHGATPGRQAAILILGLFFGTPIGWLDLPVTHWLAEMQLGMSDATVALQSWFAPATALALGLMPLVLLGSERLLAGPSEGAASGMTRLTVLTAAGAALVSWLHSWQGEALLIVILAAWLVNPDRLARGRTMLPVAAASAAPLLYQYMLTRTDVAWRIIEQTNNRPDLIVFTPQLAVLGPLVAGAGLGIVRARPRTAGEQMLVLWVLAAVAVYVFNHEFPPHALQGICLPLSVLAVRGWPEGMPARAVGWVTIAVLTVPGLAYFAKSLPPTVRGNRTLFFQTAAEHSALAYLAAAPGPGGVLAPYPLALEVPAYTDRPVWDGHQAWTPDYAQRDGDADELFSGTMPSAAAQRLVRQTGVSWVLADCPTASATIRSLGPLVRDVHKIGCAEVARVR